MLNAAAVTSASFRRNTIRVAAEVMRWDTLCSEERRILKKAHMQHLDVIKRNAVHKGALCLQELNMMALVGLQLRAKGVVPRRLHSNGDVSLTLLAILYKFRETIDIARDVHCVVWVFTALHGTEEGDEANALHKKNSILHEVISSAERSIATLPATTLVAVFVCIWRYNMQNDAFCKAAVAPELPVLQFFTSAAEHLAQPGHYNQLSLRETAEVILSIVHVRLTPEHFFDSLAIHTTDTLLPSMAATYSDPDHPREVELNEICMAITAFSKVCELGRVPVRDVMLCLAEYLMRDSFFEWWRANASLKLLTQLSYLSTAVSTKWGLEQTATQGGEEELERSVVHLSSKQQQVLLDVMRHISAAYLERQLADTERTEDVFSSRPTDARVLQNLLDCGLVGEVVTHLRCALESAHLQPEWVVKIVFSYVRLVVGKSHKNFLLESEHHKDDTEAHSTLGELICGTKPIVLAGLLNDKLRLRHMIGAFFAFTQLRETDVDFVKAFVPRIQATIAEETEGDKVALHPPYFYSNFLRSVVLNARFFDEIEMQDIFDTVQRVVANGKSDLTPEKPNHAVYILHSMSKAGYHTTPNAQALLKQICAVLSQEGVERLSMPMVAMCVQSLARFPPSTLTAQTAISVITVAAEKLERTGCNGILSVDLTFLGVTSGKWNHDDFINSVFLMSKAYVNSGSAARGVEVAEGKSLARLLWSHSIVSVRHTTLCDMIVKRMQDRPWLESAMTLEAGEPDVLAMTSSLVALSRLRIKNIAAIGGLCSLVAKNAAKMSPLSLADAVQAVAELGVPSKNLQFTLATRAAEENEDFTSGQMASFVWNATRAGLLPSVVPAEQSEQLAVTYTKLIPCALRELEKVGIQYRSRLVHSLGLLQEDCALFSGAVAELTHLWPHLAHELVVSLLPHLDQLWWKDVANVLWGVAVLKMRHLPEGSFTVFQRMRERHNFLPADEKRLVVWDAYIKSVKAESGTQ